MDINAIWTAAEPWVTTAISALLGGTGVYALCRFLLGRVLKKFHADYDINDMAEKVASRLGGKTLNIDVTAVTEKKLDKIEHKLTKKVDAIQAETASYKQLLAQIGGAVSHFKSLTEEEKAALEGAIKALNSHYVSPAPEIVATLVLEPLEIKPDKKETSESESFISFEGLTK